MEEWSGLRVNESRLQRDFDELAEIGRTEQGGVHRLALSETHLEARAWLRQKIKAAGLAARLDGADNHAGFLACGPKDAPTLLLGSHLDSVPEGGRFDGALGVLAALETLRMVKEAQLRLPVNLEVIDFTDEEGSHIPLMGSAALAGRLKAKYLAAARGGRDALREGLARAGLREEALLRAKLEASSLAGYLEVHVEQGKRLLDNNCDIGIVTAIVGIGSRRLSFRGRADHAGTISMQDRLDAGQGASAFSLAARELVLKRFPGCVVNVGRMDFAPGAFNIVPDEVRVAVEFRGPEETQMAELEGELMRAAEEAAGRFGLRLAMETSDWHPPAPMSESAQAAFRQAAEALGLAHLPLVSGAGHDAVSLAELCPVGMIFVPSVGGHSHSGREFTEWKDCVNGANALLQGALHFADKVNP